MKEKVQLLWNDKRIENMLIPIILVFVSFWDVNRGLDIYDAGYSMSYFLHFEHYSGNVMISTFWSSVVGHFFTKLPGGTTWLGLTIYCTIIVAGMILVAYFLFKPLLGWRITAVLEVFAVCLLWAPNAILYNYLSFFLFASALAILLKAIESDKTILYIAAGVILGFNTFVRISNLTQVAAIVLVWYYAFEKKRGFSKVVKRTLLCMAGYISAVLFSLVIILTLYGYEELKVGIFNLFFLSNSQEDYGIIRMATGTFLTVFAYVKYLVPLVLMVLVFAVVLRKLERFHKIIVCAELGITLLYYVFIANRFRVFNWNYNFHESVLGLVCIVLLWGLICGVVAFVWSNNVQLKMYTLVYVGTFWVLPLGSNNGIYLEMLNMFLLLPLNVYITWELLKEWEARSTENNLVECIVSLKVMLASSLLLMSFQTLVYGMNYSYMDTAPEVKTTTSNYAGVYTSQNRKEMVDSIYVFCEENELIGKEAIFYCHAPGLSFILDMPTAIDSTWANWYTFADYQFYYGLENIIREHDDGKELPIVFLHNYYHQYYEGKLSSWADPEIIVDDKLFMLFKFFGDFEYECIYTDDNYAIYRTTKKENQT